ncbi:hypothetical protein HRG_009208 [Hirsutella rhossiliensis]|uniref:Uncharacterized protein n=1 Tax=Hirsutella rhossiliensis TaxID=111463 RepID=A0A9P8MSJ0_9HYPO|nr:uncharacterized protein HRG_09208 [Hirsutella rhossiliensis]KAH0959426.1 hypothetical protein HRG_09208 [Hirsutella rhossiliensis]
MAATPFEPPHASLFDIYNDATAPPGLPCGGCNFADLTPGANGLKCGCRRFWARHVLGSPVPDQAGWCMCNHHACYHDQGPQPPPLAHAPGQENEKPRAGRDPLSPVFGTSLTTPPAFPGIDFTSFGDPAPLSFVHDLPDEYHDCSRVSASQPPGSLPDTLAWGDVMNSPAPAIANPLPPIPSQCLIPSQTASTAPSVQARYLRPFAGKGLRTLASVSDANVPSSAQQPTDVHPATHAQDASFVFVQREEQRGATSRPGSAPSTQSRVAQGPAGADVGAVRDLANTVGEHAHRLDRLETVSFHEECHDRMENIDVRMSELESRVDEVEKLTNDNASVATARAARDDDAATQSGASASTSLASRAQPFPNVLGHIQSLQAQVAMLQSYLPSPHHAWVVEVVFLPFPLKRLWQEIHQFRSDAAADGDDWTQLPMTLSTATRRSQSPFCNDWATPSNDAEWLLPRACSNTSTVDRRLRSRGLIQTVSVKGPDYRSVQAAVHAAFGSVFRELRLVPRAYPSDAPSARFLGLHQQWVPLRKVHKDSRLRFLSPAEMMTPGLWDVQFLSSVMMRSSEPRLFITHPDAYLQDSQAYAAGWTWQRVREMTRVYPDVTESSEVPEADALEEHWAWSEQLDERPPARASLSMRRDRQRVSMSPLLARGYSVRSWRRSTSPVVTRGQSPLTARWRDSAVPPLVRTTSVPVVAPARPSPAASGSRVVSHGQSRRPSPTMRVTSQARVIKRRRTRSPSHHQHFTPRWTASPSPMLPSLIDRQAPRGTTPFAYATPHSNAPLQDIRLLRGSSAARTGTMHAPEPGYVLPDVDLYGSGSDESYVDGEDDDDDDDDDDGGESDGLAARRLVLDSQRWHLPEDEPWPGIEDQDGIVEDGENVDPREQDGQSASSSQPSEYPSTNRPWPGEDAVGFRIHEDE